MRILWAIGLGMVLAACAELPSSSDRAEQGDGADGTTSYTNPATQTLQISDLTPGRPMGFRIDSEITFGQLQVYQAIITLPSAYVFNGFDALGPAGTRIGAYGFEFNSSSPGPDRLLPMYSIDNNSAYVDSNLDGTENPLKPQVEYSLDNQQNHVITITLPRGGDGSTSSNTADFSSDIMASLRTGIFTNPATAGVQAIQLNLISVDPDSGDANDNAGTAPDTLDFDRNITTASSTLSASVLPSSRSVTFGTTATAFATIANGGQTAATGCEISLLTVVKGGFSYQTTDPNTNALTGTINTPVDIPAGQSQSFVIAFTPVQEFYNSAIPFTPEDIELFFNCSGQQPALLPGVNTLLMSSGTVATPDVVSIAATNSGDGILYLGGNTTTGAIGMAAINVGATGDLTIQPRRGAAPGSDRPDFAGVPLPPPGLQLSICETTGNNGQCLGNSGTSLTVSGSYAQNAVRTFTILAKGNGETIANNPAINRIFVDFVDSDGNVRGSTSVAVTTDAAPT